MAFTYDPTLADTISQVRFIIQDKDPDYYDFEDEELQYLLDSNNDNTYKAATEAVHRLYVKFTKLASSAEVDDSVIEYQNKSEEFRILYENLKDITNKKSLTNTVPVCFTGQDVSDFNSVREDSTKVDPDFTKGSVEFNTTFPELTPVNEKKVLPGTFWGY